MSNWGGTHRGWERVLNHSNQIKSNRIAPSRIAHDRIPTFRWDYRWMPYPGGVNTRHPHDHSVMTYRGHEVLNTLIRAYFSPPQT